MANLKSIEKYLRNTDLPYKVVPLNEKAYTVEDVTKSGINLDEVVKTLVVRIQDESFIALALCGNDRVDFKKVRRLFGSKSELAKPEEVLRAVGVPIGAVCPVQIGIPLYFDKKVMNLEKVHMGSGDLEHGLEMRLSDLLKVCEGYKAEEIV